ncbi:MAG TPA: LPS export ABC transporter periplasmic protein LptC, partial [Rhizobiaceae bacterium]|nr:LPS export ABC transporter periplasmic protein LptC [Rhizobiaceae bacterium]
VRVLKFALPLIGLVGAAGFGAWTWVLSEVPVSVDLSDSTIKDGKLVMSNPKLNGFTQDRRPYAMTAARAVQDLSQPQIIALENIVAKLPIDAKNEAQVRAPAGVFDNGANTLELKGAFVVKTTDGMTAKMQSAFIDMNSNDLKTADPVDITLDDTHIVADSMNVTKGGKVMTFERNVRVVMQPSAIRKPGDGADRQTTQD